MSDAMTPAQYWRSMIRSDVERRRRIRPDEDDGAFRSYAEREYLAAKEHLAHPEGLSPQTLAGWRVGAYLAAIALLTYGRLDVVSDILDNTPPQPSPMWALERAVSALIPLPAGMDVHRDRRAVRDWIVAHSADLHWDAPAGRFVGGG